MLFRLIRTEAMKLKRAPVWLAFLVLPILPALMGSLNYQANIGILQEQWWSLWTQHTLFTVYFFLPLTIGIGCAYIMRQEQQQHNWNKLLSMPLPKAEIFLAKLICAGAMLLLCLLWIGPLFVLSGKLLGLTAPLPVKELCTWLLFGTLGGMVLCSSQLLLSLLMSSFALPVGISLACGISALVFLAKDMGHIWPWALMAYGLNSNAPQQLMETGRLSFVVICLIYTALFSALGCFAMSRRDN